MPETSPWISVGNLAAAFSPDSNAPRPTDDLVGKNLDLYLEDGRLITHRFDEAGRLSWTMPMGDDAGRGAEESYFAAKVRDGIYFVDYVRHLERATTITLALDLSREIVTVLVGRLPDEAEVVRSWAERIAQGEDLTPVSVEFLSGSIGSPFTGTALRHQPTGEMVGRRVEYTYSRTERYEHVYLNERFYTWHCIPGSEQGLADTDRCHYYKLADNLYLFVWREKIVPTLGIVTVDFDRMRSLGKILGYEHGNSGRLANFVVGARARQLNFSSHG